ncbi:MAG: hypothetical protein A2826_01160 [Candidatus Doudnabacteria bacterium RIFCSPHIGHO2_01_FULL_43_23]|uniref:Uncharacterized protein n=1 Tax=Candidatus Doudnabacteria bacterium RIFCSPHIGHO2_01_FULL_43_23 TaxID=1817822 RepID=A0A1F5NSN5_9BACT|nr:MAG: hypothetical protein A2826_01160 [Candidatus Doudnabacteria bacterium RIFCSPHIGHO2_01_FULL_43_23]
MELKTVKDPITIDEIKQLALDSFIDMVKGAVDIEKAIMVLGGSMHVDAEQALLASGSTQDDIWGINIYPDKSPEDRIQYESLINIRPRQNNQSMEIQDPVLRGKIAEIVNGLIKSGLTR